jgi:hypothetical protein
VLLRRRERVTASELGEAGALGREIPPKVLAERKAGRYLWDVFVHGTTTGLESMIPAGSFDPLEPALLFVAGAVLVEDARGVVVADVRVERAHPPPGALPEQGGPHRVVERPVTAVASHYQ